MQLIDNQNNPIKKPIKTINLTLFIEKVKFFPNGKLKLKYYCDVFGRLQGPFEAHNENGLLEKANYINNVLHGLYETYSQNNCLMMKTTFVNDKMNGVCKYLNENGELSSVYNYRHDILHGLCEEYYENNQLYFKTNYSDGKLHGLYEKWYPDGKIQERLNYYYGMYHGLYEKWYPDGKIQEKINYYHGMYHGQFEYWRDDGSKLTLGNYRYGNIHGIQETYGTRFKNRNYAYNGELHGLCEAWMDKQLIRCINYSHGQFHGICKFDKNSTDYYFYGNRINEHVYNDIIKLISVLEIQQLNSIIVGYFF